MKHLIFIPIILGISVMSCRKETNEDEVSEEEAVEAVARSMDADNSGMTAQLSMAAELTESAMTNPICAQQFDSSLVKSNSTASMSFNYNFDWGWSVTCNSMIPQSIDFTYTASGSYSGTRMTSNDNATGTIVVTGINAGDAEYIANINYSRTGSASSKFGMKNTFDNTITISGSNITIDKTSYELTSGTANASISGTHSNGTSFSFSGTVTFLGGGSATLQLANGNSYTISI